MAHHTTTHTHTHTHNGREQLSSVFRAVLRAACFFCVSAFPGYLPFGGAAKNVADVVHDTLSCKPSFDEVQWSAVSEVKLAASRCVSLFVPSRGRQVYLSYDAIKHACTRVPSAPLRSRCLGRADGDLTPEHARLLCLSVCLSVLTGGQRLRQVVAESGPERTPLR